MTMYARPIADVTREGWDRFDGGTTELVRTLNQGELLEGDNSYIQTGAAPAGAVYVAKLSPPYPYHPNLRTGHKIRLRCKKDSAGGATVNLTAELREGYVSEGTPGTLIHSGDVEALGGEDWMAVEIAIPEAAAQTITDYGNLYLRLVATQEV